MRLLAAAYALDLLLGDPQQFPHPVRAMGSAIEHGERAIRCRTSATPANEAVAGSLLSCAIVGTTFACSLALLQLAKRFDLRLESVLIVILSASTLATRSLLDEAAHVARALEHDDLPRARIRLARIVGRNTNELGESEIARATIETLAESLCDGTIAPLCALALAGAPGAMAFKAISTLDSMIGHPEAPYTYFGRFAARLDDVANFIPARITALLLTLTAGPDIGRTWRVWMRDGNLHRSPNAGQCEAAMAGALGVRLGGKNSYDGIVHETPQLGVELRAPRTTDIREAMKRTLRVSLLGGFMALLVQHTLAKQTAR